MSARAQALEAVKVGDLVLGIAAGGQEKLLLVYKSDKEGFSARHVTTQMKFRFSRDGRTQTYPDGGYIKIVSTAVLPPEQHRIAANLDHKMGSKLEYPDTKLTRSEIDFLLTHVDFFMRNPLPEQ